MEDIDNYKVILGNNQQISSVGRYVNVLLKVQGLKIVREFLPMELGSLDIILGCNVCEL